MPAPSLSVVVVILGGPVYLTRCLQALLFQTNVQDIEIIVPCDERISDVLVLQKQFPAVWFLTIGGHRTFAELRALGVGKARGAIIALTEDHCTPNPDWCTQILRAHAGPHAAVGGAVDKEGADTALNWALYLADYVRYTRPMAEGPASQLTDCNVSYKRSALQAVGDVWHDEFHEPAVHGALQARGESLWFSPHIIVQQQRRLGLGDAARDRYAFGRLFGSGRVTKGQGGWSKQGAKSRKQGTGSALLRGVIYAGFAFLLPPVLVGRIAMHVFHKRRYVGAFVRALPALVFLTSVWVWGEIVGYLTGRPGNSLKGGVQRAQTS